MESRAMLFATLEMANECEVGGFFFATSPTKPPLPPRRHRGHRVGHQGRLTDSYSFSRIKEFENGQEHP